MSTALVTLTASPEDLARGAWLPSDLDRAVRAIEEDGVVVLEHVIPLNLIETLRERVLADVERYLARDDRPFNWVSGNLQQDPPPMPPFLFREVMANDLVIEVTSAVMGEGMFNSMWSGNTALPSEARQPVHADSGQLWPNLKVATPPYSLVVNVPLVDMGPENGSTEIWPGTHLDTSVTMQGGDIKVSAEVQEARRAVRPPLQPVVKAGSVVVRDMRMWHAGMPNRTDRPRPMLAMIHNVGWWPAGPFPLHRDGEEILRHPKLRQHATWFDGEVDYIAGPQAYEYVK